MRKYRTAACVLIVFFMVAFIFFTASSPEAKLILFVISLLLLLVLNRGNALYTKAARIIARKNPAEREKAVMMMEKALQIGCSESNTVSAATFVLQHGNIETAGKGLEEASKSSFRDTRGKAKAALSMYYWIKGDLNKALDLAEDAKREKNKDAALYVNLCTYYLAKNDKKKYRATLAEAVQNKIINVSLVDIQAIYFILSGEYEKAGATLERLMQQVKPNTSAPYIHYAMVYLRYGHVKDAVSMLKEALEKPFSNTSLLSIDEIESMVDGLETPETRLMWVDAVNSNRMMAVRPGLPKLKNAQYGKSSDDVLPGYPVLPDFTDPSILSIREEKIDEYDSREIDTDLTKDDEAWLKKHDH